MNQKNKLALRSAAAYIGIMVIVGSLFQIGYVSASDSQHVFVTLLHMAGIMVFALASPFAQGIVFARVYGYPNNIFATIVVWRLLASLVITILLGMFFFRMMMIWSTEHMVTSDIATDIVTSIVSFYLAGRATEYAWRPWDYGLDMDDDGTLDSHIVNGKDK